MDERYRVRTTNRDAPASSSVHMNLKGTEPVVSWKQVFFTFYHIKVIILKRLANRLALSLC